MKITNGLFEFLVNVEKFDIKRQYIVCVLTNCSIVVRLSHILTDAMCVQIAP